MSSSTGTGNKISKTEKKSLKAAKRFECVCVLVCGLCKWVGMLGG